LAVEQPILLADTRDVGFHLHGDQPRLFPFTDATTQEQLPRFKAAGKPLVGVRRDAAIDEPAAQFHGVNRSSCVRAWVAIGVYHSIGVVFQLAVGSR
jgi:hypothetical protein